MHLTRRARGLPFWFTLAVHGTDAFTEAVETTLAPGQTLGMQLCGRDAAVFVVQPSKLKVVERAAGAEQVKEETRNAKDVRWTPGGVERELVNVGPSTYRQISVEVK